MFGNSSTKSFILILFSFHRGVALYFIDKVTIITTLSGILCFLLEKREICICKRPDLETD